MGYAERPLEVRGKVLGRADPGTRPERGEIPDRLHQHAANLERHWRTAPVDAANDDLTVEPPVGGEPPESSLDSRSRTVVALWPPVRRAGRAPRRRFS